MLVFGSAFDSLHNIAGTPSQSQFGANRKKTAEKTQVAVHLYSTLNYSSSDKTSAFEMRSFQYLGLPCIVRPGTPLFKLSM